MRRIAVLVMLILQCSLLQAGDNWPQFRGPEGDGRSDAVGLPLRWSDTENVKWKTAIHGRGLSSPVVWGNQVWMTTATEDGKEQYAVCLDRDTGKVLHDIAPVPQRQAAADRPDEQLRLADAGRRRRPRLRQLRLLWNRVHRYGDGQDPLGTAATSSAITPSGRARRPSWPTICSFCKWTAPTCSTSSPWTRATGETVWKTTARPTTATAAPSIARPSARRC